MFTPADQVKPVSIFGVLVSVRWKMEYRVIVHYAAEVAVIGGIWLVVGKIWFALCQ